MSLFPVGRIVDAISEPFQHYVIEDVYPVEIHQELLRSCPPLSPHKKDMANLELLQGVWKDVQVTKDEGDEISRRLGTKTGEYKSRLVRDPGGYSLGPHTDDPKKVWAFVYYLMGENGTVLFTPKKHGFEHDGLAHLEFKDFNAVKRFPFKPNSMVGFARTNTSFHGVEPTKGERWTILYNCFS